MRISMQLARIEWIETAGELGALLTEARLVKELLPVHNRLLRRAGELCAFRWTPGAVAARRSRATSHNNEPSVEPNGASSAIGSASSVAKVVPIAAIATVSAVRCQKSGNSSRAGGHACAIQ